MQNQLAPRSELTAFADQSAEASDSLRFKGSTEMKKISVKAGCFLAIGLMAGCGQPQVNAMALYLNESQGTEQVAVEVSPLSQKPKVESILMTRAMVNSDGQSEGLLSGYYPDRLAFNPNDNRSSDTCEVLHPSAMAVQSTTNCLVNGWPLDGGVITWVVKDNSKEIKQLITVQFLYPTANQ